MYRLIKKYSKSFVLVLLFVSGSLSAQKHRLIDSLKLVLEVTKQDTTRINLMNDIGGYLLNSGDYAVAEKYLVKAQKLSEDINYKSGLSTAFSRLGIMFMDKSDAFNAAENYEKALQLKKEIGDKKGYADVTSNIGILYCDRGDYAKALENYFAALKIREEIKDKSGIGISLMSIGNIYFLQNKFSTALEYYLNIVKAQTFGNRKILKADVYTNIGLAYLRLNNYSKALDYFTECLKIDEEIGNKQGIAISLTNIGAVYSTQKNYKKALELIGEGCELFKKVGDKKGVVEAYYELGNIHDSLKQHDKALEYFNKQLILAKEINSKLNIKHAYIGISNQYKKTNKFKESLDYYVLYKAMEDSLQNESSLKSIAELETKYKFQKKEKEIELLKKEQELNSIKNEKRKQLTFAIVILALAISLTSFLLYNRHQLKKKNVLERKNFELERNALSAQMNPHFIFNSLGSISGFISENEKEKAIEYLGVFSRLIRHNLEQSREQLVSVTDEAEMLRSYLHLQQLRFDNKFDYTVSIENGMDDALAIPPMFIQPFVENAILHGIIPSQSKGNLIVKFHVKNEQELICEVIDNGIGKAESLKRKSEFIDVHKSLAMTITEERKEIMNSKNKQQIVIISNDIVNDKGQVSGTHIKLTFPLEYV